jgi:hypothetical protein
VDCSSCVWDPSFLWLAFVRAALRLSTCRASCFVFMGPKKTKKTQLAPHSSCKKISVLTRPSARFPGAATGTRVWPRHCPPHRRFLSCSSRSSTELDDNLFFFLCCAPLALRPASAVALCSSPVRLGIRSTLSCICVPPCLPIVLPFMLFLFPPLLSAYLLTLIHVSSTGGARARPSLLFWVASVVCVLGV